MGFRTPSISIKYWIILGSLIIAAPLIGHQYYLTEQYLGELRHRDDISIERRLNTTISILREHIARSEEILAILGVSEEAKRGDWLHLYKKAQEAVNREELLSAITLVDSQYHLIFGTLIPFGAAHPIAAEQDNLSKIFATGMSTMSGPFLSPFSKNSAGAPRWVVAIGMPIVRGGKVVGVLRAIMPCASLAAILSNYKYSDGWLSTLTDAKGQIIARSTSQEVNVGKQVNSTLLEIIKKASEEQQTIISRDGKQYIAKIGYVEKGGWSVQVGYEKYFYDLAVKTALKENIYIFVFEVLLAITFAWTVAARIAKKCSAVVDAAKTVAAGGATQFIATNTLELDNLQREFVTIAASQKNLLNVVQSKSLELESINKKLEETVQIRTAELTIANNSLETRVVERTNALAKTRDALEKLNERFSLAMEAAQEGLWDWNLHTGYVYYSPGWGTMLGYTSTTLVPDVSTWANLIDDNQRETIVRKASQYLRDPGHYTLEFRMLRANGDYAWIRSSGKVVARNAAGEPLRAIGTHVDITELKEARLEAEAGGRAKTTFLANMSHEIRTPLNGVLGLAQIGFEQTEEHTKANSLFKKILQSGQLLLTVINEILDFSKIEAGKIDVEKIAFDPSQLVDSVIDQIKSQADAKKLLLRVERSDLPAAGLGDPNRIAQILLNLLTNAIKFTAQGEVILSACRDGDELVFAVRDTGVGMSPDNIKKLFRPFEQADSSTTRKYGGTGLGLAISSRLTSLLGGSISVDSAVNQGSTFSLRLPLREVAAQSVPKQKVSTKIKAQLQGLRLLVAEDNPTNQFVIEELLKNEGAKVTVCDNGQQALATINAGAGNFDAVLMDFQMPVMDGLEASRILRKSYPQLPIIGQTAHALEEERLKGFEAGMNAVITKPIDKSEMIRVLLAHLSKTSLLAMNSQSNSIEQALSITKMVDWEAMKNMNANRAGAADHLIQSFVNLHAADASYLRRFSAQANFLEIVYLTHSLKGTLDYLHASSVSELAGEVMALANAKSPETFDQARHLAETMDALLEELRNSGKLT